MSDNGAPSIDDHSPDQNVADLDHTATPSPARPPFTEDRLRDLPQTVQQAVANAQTQPSVSSETQPFLASVRPAGTASPFLYSLSVGPFLMEKILRCGYVDFTLLLPDSQTQPQGPTIQF